MLDISWAVSPQLFELDYLPARRDCEIPELRDSRYRSDRNVPGDACHAREINRTINVRDDINAAVVAWEWDW